jgi:SAM-dependent methyltransferase
MNNPAQDHYDSFLAGYYGWASGGTEDQVRKNTTFFTTHSVTHRNNRVAIDLGAGCGFQSIPLARLGYSVTAVDFSRPLLDELRMQAGELPVVTVQSDIRNYCSWAGLNPALIVCMGDTLTHLNSLKEAESLICQCYSELETGGKLVLSLRDYSREPDGAVVVIPVQRESGRIFLCRLEYHASTLTVQDILYSRGPDFWERNAGRYEKIRIGPDTLARMLTGAGFAIDFSSDDDGMITVIARKDE